LFEPGLGQRCVRCPECRGVCVWRGLHELPKNYILLRVLSSSSSTHRPTESGSEIARRPLVLPNLPIISQISSLSSQIIEHMPRMVERKLWDLGKLSWALIAMSVFLPFSFVHMVLAWTTAVLGSIVCVVLPWRCGHCFVHAHHMVVSHHGTISGRTSFSSIF
jgi:hypothetical protein